MIRYELASDIDNRIFNIIEKIEMMHIKRENVICIRSNGSGSRGIVARCHALSKIWQKAFNTDAFYLIEVIAEKFDKLSEEEKTKVLIHELLHIPKCFGGGFKHHGFVNSQNIDAVYRKFLKNSQ